MGFLAEYSTLQGAVLLARDDGNVLNIESFNSSNAFYNDPLFKSDERQINGLAVHWSGGFRALYSETYTFYVRYDNSARVLVDNVQKLDVSAEIATSTFTITLQAGRIYALDIFYKNLIGYAGSNPATFKIEWESVSQARELLPYTKPCDHGDGRAITEALEAHFGGIQRTPAYLWLVEPQAPLQASTQRPVEGFTAHDRDIVYNPDPARFDEPILFRSVGGLSPSEVPANISLNVDSSDVFLLLSTLTRARLMTRYYEGARASILLVNYEDLTQKHTNLMGGRLRTAEVMIPQSVTFKLSTWSELLNRSIGRVASVICPFRFLYGHCRNNVNGLGEVDEYFAPDDGPKPSDPNKTQNGTISEIIDNAHFKLDGFGTSAPTGWANEGYLRFVGGEYDGAEFQIKKWTKLAGTAVEVWLREPMPLLPDVDSAVAIEEGCAHTMPACNGKGNAINFGGQDKMPTEEVLTQNKK